MFVHFPDERVFGFAGIWERWRERDETDGRVVIAALDGGLTVKLLARRRDGVFLLPANKAYRIE